mgnify:CR=1 FL=1
MPRSHVSLLIVSAMLLLPHALRGDTLVTLDGRSLDGTARFESDALVFSPRGGSTLKFPLNEVLHLSFDGPAAPVLSQGLVLADGSRVRVRDFVSSDGRTLRLRTNDGQERTCSLGMVAALVFAEPSLPESPPTDPGAVLSNGDFFAGELLAIKDNQLAVSSVLFGIRRFRLGQDVQSFWVRVPRKLDGPRLLNLSDGSSLEASNAVLRDGKLHLEHALAGRLALQPRDIREIRVAGPRVAALSSFRIVEPPAASLVPAVRIEAGERDARIFQRCGSTVSFDLPPDAEVLITEIGTAPGSLPVAGLRFLVLVDGRPVANSEPITALDAPKRLAAPVRGAKRLTLVVESQPALDLPLIGLWNDPLIVRD